MKTIRDIHINGYKKCIILGNGMSVINVKDISKDIFTIGVNDICKMYIPDILFLVDAKHKFNTEPERINFIESNPAKYNLMHDDSWNFNKESKYMFEFGISKSLSNIDNKSLVDTGLDSPYMAAQVAYKLGFTKIGFLGVDYTANHFYKDDGEHKLVTSNKLDTLNELYMHLYRTLSIRRIEVTNLNEYSKIVTIPFSKLENF